MSTKKPKYDAFPRIPIIENAFACDPSPSVEPDLRLRTDPDEVLAGLDDGTKFFHVWGTDFALGPGNVGGRGLRYSQQTLLELQQKGLVAAYDSEGKARTDFQEFVSLCEQTNADPERDPDANDMSNTLIWRKVL
jgi:hypothetical protein